jgi:putative transposase
VSADFEIGLAEFNGEANHVDLPVNLPPTTALSRLVKRLKGVSSGGCDRSSRTCGGTTGGRTGYGRLLLRRIGRRRTISVLLQYIEQQNRPA